MKLKNSRNWKKSTYTIGAFFIDGIRFCEIVEDADRGLNSSMDASYILIHKIPGQTAIPTGTYKIILSVSSRFKNRSWAKKYGGLVPELVGVKGFNGVRIHPGLDADSTSGCLIPGDNKIKGGVINSQKRYYELMDKYIVPAWSRKEDIYITIK